jgi:gliding motility-associated-like protein
LAVYKFDFEKSGAIADFQPSTNRLCAGSPVAFVNKSTLNCRYLWDFGDQSGSQTYNVSHIFTNPGTYRVKLIVQDTLRCFNTDSTFATIVVDSFPNLSIQKPITICPGQSIQLNAGGASSYRWSPGSFLDDSLVSNPKATIFSSTQFKLVAFSGLGCVDSMFVTVPVLQFPQVINRNYSICLGKKLTLSPAIDSSIFKTANWLPAPGITDTNILIQKIEPANNQKYIIRLVTFSNCIIYDTSDVNVNVALVSKVEFPKVVCSEVPFRLKAKGGISYLWNTGDTTETITVKVKSDSIFWVTAFKGECRSFPDTARVSIDTVKARFTIEFDTIYAPGKTNLISSNSNQFGFWWSIDEKPFTQGLQTYLASFVDTGTYKAKLAIWNNQTGCRDTSANQLIHVLPVAIKVPNAFSPNNDKLNDLFFAKSLNQAAVGMKIYSRWGELLFETSNPDIGWDGTSKGRICSPDTYIYVISALGKNDQIEEFRGIFALIR